jgi:hypothetical protein
MDPLNKIHGWHTASLQIAQAFEKTVWLAGQLRQWARADILDREDLPLNIYGMWNSSILEDEDFAEELLLHLQETGKFVRAADIVDYIARPHVMAHLKLTKSIFLAMAKHWMKHVSYRWTKCHWVSMLMGMRELMGWNTARQNFSQYSQSCYLACAPIPPKGMSAWCLP